MATGGGKTIHEYQCCAKSEKTKNFSGYTWPNIKRNYKFYSVIDDLSTFQSQDALYLFKDTTKECTTLRRNNYLLKLASAIAFFGEQNIIERLNQFYELEINESAASRQSAYTVPQFRQWKDVTKYVGNRDHPSLRVLEREKKQRVYDQMCIIAQQKGISSENWNTLTSLYHDRNSLCHPAPNTADTESMREYTNLIDDPMERDSVRILSDLIITALPTTRRYRR